MDYPNDQEKTKLDQIVDILFENGHQDVNAHIQEGIIILKGTVPSWESKNEIKNKVTSIPGIYGIHDHLKIDIQKQNFAFSNRLNPKENIYG